MTLAYWMLIVISFGAHDDIAGTQPTHYKDRTSCEVVGKGLIAQYPPTQLLVNGQTVPGSSQIDYRCAPVYQ